MRKPLISVLTPTYNHESYINQCIDSVLAQDYPYWEQIIVDDGSTDKTHEILSEYSDERIKYIKQKNLGIFNLSKTYNKALKYASGDLIAILEGDDFWPSKKFEKQIPTFYDEEVILSWGKSGVTNIKGDLIYINPRRQKLFKNMSKEELIRELIVKNFIPACTAIIRRDALDEIKGFKQPKNVPFVDYPTWLELSLIGNFCSIDEVLGYWRQSEKQMTKKRIEMANGGRRCGLEFYNRLPSKLINKIGIDYSTLLRKKQENIAAAYFFSGREKLIQNEWDEARKMFIKSFRGGSPSRKVKSTLGIICSYLYLDIEWLASLTNQPRIDTHELEMNGKNIPKKFKLY